MDMHMHTPLYLVHKSRALTVILKVKCMGSVCVKTILGTMLKHHGASLR